MIQENFKMAWWLNYPVLGLVEQIIYFFVSLHSFNWYLYLREKQARSGERCCEGGFVWGVGFENSHNANLSLLTGNGRKAWFLVKELKNIWPFQNGNTSVWVKASLMALPCSWGKHSRLGCLCFVCQTSLSCDAFWKLPNPLKSWVAWAWNNKWSNFPYFCSM